MEYLKINSEDGYLNIQDLPHDCIFNKVITGCGGTTVALRNGENYVIAVPTTELIINKIKREDAGLGLNNVFGLFGFTSYTIKKEFKEYVEAEGIKKIMCTYDKLPMIVKMLEPSDFRLLVDEYHILLKAYSYRADAIRGVLGNYKKFKSACFMSATPIMPDFKPEELEGLKEIQAEWNNTDKITVNIQQSNKPFLTAANIITHYITDGFIEVNGAKSYEGFFFINSVEEIANIMQHCNIDNTNARVICADTEANRRKLGTIEISNSNSENKPITFLTCKSFEGVDYFSETGLSFVVSSSAKTQTQASIDTDIPQIAGRIRNGNNPFRNKIVHIMNNTKDETETTFEEMEKKMKIEKKVLNVHINLYNEAEDEEEKEFHKKAINEDYVYIEDGKMCYNDILAKLTLYNFRVKHIVYADGLSIRKEYERQGIQTTNVCYNNETENIKQTKAISFREAYLEALANKSNPVVLDRLYQIDLVKEAIENLTPAQVKTARYVKKNVKELLIAKNDELNKYTKAIKMIKEEMPYGEFIPVKKVKEMLARIYKTLGINKTAKATDISLFFYAKECAKWINGATTKTIAIVRPRATVVTKI